MNGNVKFIKKEQGESSNYELQIHLTSLLYYNFYNYSYYKLTNLSTSQREFLSSFKNIYKLEYGYFLILKNKMKSSP